MSIKKKLLLVAGLAVLMASFVMAEPHAEAEAVKAEAVEAEIEEDVAAEPEPQAVVQSEPEPQSAPVQVSAPVVVSVPEKLAAKFEVTPYGSASYRYRGRIWTASADDNSATTWDHINMLSWFVGLRAKVDDHLSLQFQIGNDWTAGENVSWSMNNTAARSILDNNMYVHLAYARWNPGYMYIDAGVIPLSSNGTLDLLERSLNTGSYNEAVYQGWPAQTNNRLTALRLGVPLLNEGVKLSAEALVSAIDQRTQRVSSFNGIGVNDSLANPASFLVMLNLPVTAGALKVTPEFTAVVNRNYNKALEQGDHEILGGLSAGYKISDAVSVSLFGGYGAIGNENSRAGSYGGTVRSDDRDRGDSATVYNSVGIQFGVGTSIKAGPGTFAFDFRFGNSVDDINEARNTATNTNNIYIDPRYTWNIHPKFTIAPRWRIYISTYDDSQTVTMRMENRPEIVIGGSF